LPQEAGDADVTLPLVRAWVISLELAWYLHWIRTTYDPPRLRAIANALEATDPNDHATLPLLRMIALKVVRLERSS
jgi:hypothetical protein